MAKLVTNEGRGFRYSSQVMRCDLGMQAAMGMESKEDWAEIMDSRMNGNCNLNELGDMANIAYKCVGPEGRRRPKMRAVAQSLCNLGKKPSKEHVLSMPVIREDPPAKARSIPKGERSKPVRSQKDPRAQLVR